MDNKIAVFGGSLMKRLIDKLSIVKSVEEKCMWIHPLSFNKEDTIDGLNSKEKVTEFFENSKADYLLIELSSTRFSLFERENGNYYRNEDIRKFSEIKEVDISGKMISIDAVSEEQIEYSVSVLCDLIKNHYSMDKVCLISSVPMKGMINKGGYYIPSSKYWINACRVMKKIEQKVQRELDCQYIEITQRHIPKEKSDSYLFYECFYENVEIEIKKFLDMNASDDDYKIQDNRYFYVAKTFRSLYKKQVHEMLLDSKNPVDCCVLYTNEQFINQYNDILIELRNIDLKSIDELKAYLYKQPLNECFKKLISLVNIRNANYQVEDILNVNNLDIIKWLCKELGSEMHKYISSFCEKTITKNNVIFYFEYLNYIKLNHLNFSGGGESNQIKYLLNQVKKPMLVDIFGSCLSRFIFNYAEEIEDSVYIVNEYVFHANPLEINSDSDDNRSYSAQLNENIYAERNLKIQIDGRIREKYMRSNSEWIVIDFYVLYADHIFKSSKRNYIIGKELGNKIFPNGKMESICKSYKYDDIVNGIRQFAEFVVERYGTKIILISAKNSELYRSNGRLIPFENKEDIRNINIFLDKIEKDFVSMTDCFYININQFFYPDDEQISLLTPYHYERGLYLAEYKLIRQICEGSFLSNKKQIDSININFIDPNEKN